MYIPVVEKLKAIKRCGINCFYCGKEGIIFKCNHRVHEKRPLSIYGSGTDVMHFDHVIPLCAGGKNTAENIVISCQKCNLSKGRKIINAMV